MIIRVRLRESSGYTTAYAPGGECFISLCAGGVKKQGEVFPCWYASEELAKVAYAKTLQEYKVQFSPLSVLCWRTPPEITTLRVFEKTPDPQDEESVELTFYSVYSRLAIVPATTEGII